MATGNKTQTSQTHALVGLFVTCPVDLFRPSVADSTITLITNLGYQIDVPVQSCCGQIGYNNGDTEQTKKVALNTARLFRPHDYVVVPSGSCASMLKNHYLELFAEDHPDHAEIKTFSQKVYELTQFLESSDIKHPHAVAQSGATSIKGKVTYHDSCAGLRELKIKNQPRALLKQHCELDITEMPDTNVCCGFGGTFCVKFSDISNKMVTDKLDNARSVEANMLVGGDLSCLLNIAGAMHRQADNAGHPRIEVRHIAELLANNLTDAAIGDENG